ncbi:MAG: Asp-tRNA(Asn)/Glu-tRNA(Gln) amidotransferase subunit GatA [Patescibacteria group bacterium]|nr:Asp-tRNA(Asn)/Glu-tRNA(Gln) amidotransferase subunit GatA [Patescibacteria group bacterium]MDE1944192.1 Asp-tRNA(Asn)/Glu-tRNA(Gln) amidotransferase subunit GatA [Patescibacteria group bacterium]MDE1945307.1 Asp-tRNA(Asn)/Glu-tRNA(Gln) amidotransferase subunit GatA [Patescibacteria group bacterium]MDE2057583.1 Asp-tRNA(Asn)/Glu-tRNA(Gln) amidotransferase subunit GatA [Patescibacteria group bacterium]
MPQGRGLNELTIAEAARGLRAKAFTVRALWDACAAAARERNGELHAYLELFDADDAAIAAAERRIDTEGDAAPLLCGIPLAVKDNILIEGRVASAASKMLEHYRATYDATVIEKLREQGALFLGRTNMDEFALGGSTENSAFGVTKNPHDPSRVAGGTSGGSAAAVAAHLAIAALGTDTGGSVRNPASHCGVVGLKPTYGAVSRAGVIAAASSFDQVGPLAKTAEDARILFDAIRGADPLDSTTAPDGLYAAPAAPERLRIGVPRALLAHAGLDAGVKARFEETLERLTAAGHTLVDVEIPSAAPSLAAYYIINFAEVSTNLARYDGIRYGLAARGDTLLADYVRSRTEGFGPETRRRILLGTFVLSAGYIDAYYKKANAARAALRREFATAFEEADVIATPTMPTTAFRIGEKSDPLALYLEDAYTVLANLTGLPAISAPMPAAGGLPAGIHFTAPHAGEARLFAAAAAVHNLAAAA